MRDARPGIIRHRIPGTGSAAGDHKDPRELTRILEHLYRRYQRRVYVHPDPVEFLYGYENAADREITGLVAASLAYGRVTQILRSVASVLALMGPSPSRYLEDAKKKELLRTFRHFKHRFSTGEELVELLAGIRRVLDKYGTLYACMKHHFSKGDDTVVPALTHFTEELRSACASSCNSLLPLPTAGSACKRLNLYLRWMVRRDGVDVGDWEDILPSKLVVPLDTHMHRISIALGFTKRSQANMKTALEITAAFRTIAPADPVRYDFILTRPGIWKHVGISDMFPKT